MDNKPNLNIAPQVDVDLRVHIPGHVVVDAADRHELDRVAQQEALRSHGLGENGRQTR